MPSGHEHHAVLGQFIHVWGHVESNLYHLFGRLSGVDELTARLIADGMGIRKTKDAVVSLSTLKLNEEGVEIIINLTERVSRLMTKRNTLVHGHWVVEFAVFPWKQEVKAKPQLLREAVPSDRRLVEKISDLKNQKERVKYTFTLKRILSATFDAVNLLQDIARISQIIDGYLITERAH